MVSVLAVIKSLENIVKMNYTLNIEIGGLPALTYICDAEWLSENPEETLLFYGGAYFKLFFLYIKRRMEMV